MRCSQITYEWAAGHGICCPKHSTCKIGSGVAAIISGIICDIDEMSHERSIDCMKVSLPLTVDHVSILGVVSSIRTHIYLYSCTSQSLRLNSCQCCLAGRRNSTHAHRVSAALCRSENVPVSITICVVVVTIGVVWRHKLNTLVLKRARFSRHDTAVLHFRGNWLQLYHCDRLVLIDDISPLAVIIVFIIVSRATDITFLINTTNSTLTF